MVDVNHWQDPIDITSLPQVRLQRDGRQWSLAGLHEEDHIFKTIRESGEFYENGLLSFLGHFLEPNDLVLDVGANIGNHTVWFAGVMGCTVRAFEPIPVIAQVLARNVILNMLDAQVRVEPFAVGAKSSSASVTRWQADNSGGTEITAAEVGPLTVVALDDLSWTQPVRLIKIDVEGMELDVLRGARDIVHRDKPVLAVEARDEASDTAVRAWLEDHYYSVLGVFNATPTIVAAPNGNNVGKRSDNYVATAVESLIERFGDFEKRLDRFGRYLHEQTASAAEERQASRAPRSDHLKTSGEDEVIKSMQRHIDNLEARLASAQEALTKEGLTTPPVDPRGNHHD